MYFYHSVKYLFLLYPQSQYLLSVLNSLYFLYLTFWMLVLWFNSWNLVFIVLLILMASHCLYDSLLWNSFHSLEHFETCTFITGYGYHIINSMFCGCVGCNTITNMHNYILNVLPFNFNTAINLKDNCTWLRLKPKLSM